MKASPSISYFLVDRDSLLATGRVVRSDLTYRLDGHSLFRIGSLTKMFTAICIMQMAAKGMLDVDADVSTYLPGFRPVNPFAGRDSRPFGSQRSRRKPTNTHERIVRAPPARHHLAARRPPPTDTDQRRQNHTN